MRWKEFSPQCYEKAEESSVRGDNCRRIKKPPNQNGQLLLIEKVNFRG